MFNFINAFSLAIISLFIILVVNQYNFLILVFSFFCFCKGISEIIKANKIDQKKYYNCLTLILLKNQIIMS